MITFRSNGSWYSGLENLEQVNGFGWVWLTRLKANRLVNPDRSGLRPVARVGVETGAEGQIVHLKGYGLIRLFTMVAPDGDREWWATNDLQMRPLLDPDTLRRLQLGRSNITIGTSSSSAVSNGLRCVPPAPNAITSV